MPQPSACPWNPPNTLEYARSTFVLSLPAVPASLLSSQGPGTGKKGTRSQDSWGRRDLSRCGCSLNPSLACSPWIFTSSSGGKKRKPKSHRSLGTPGKLGKCLNMAIPATQTSPGPRSSSLGFRPEGLGPVEQGRWAPGGSRMPWQLRCL